MRKSREFDNILEECLEQILVHGVTVEQCLQDYPAYAEELRPLLETALVTQRASAIHPRPEFRDRARYQFQVALRDIETGERRSFFNWQPRWVAAVASIIILLVIGSSTVVAASRSMPGEFLYPVKLATEQVQLWFTPSSLGKAELYAELADKRIVEIVSMAEEDNPEQIELTAQRLDTYLAEIADLASTQPVTGEAVMAPAFQAATEEGALGLKEEAVEVEEEAVLVEEEAVRIDVETAMPPQVVAPPSLSEWDDADGAVDNTIDRRAKLKIMVMRYAINHPARLRALLEKVSPSTRAALLEVIDLSETGYERALKSLD